MKTQKPIDSPIKNSKKDFVRKNIQNLLSRIKPIIKKLTATASLHGPGGEGGNPS
jgi:hypothetical protein